MNELLEELRGIVGDKGIVYGEDLRTRAASSLDTSAHQAIALVRPQSTDELSQVMSICNRNNQVVVIQGGMTGLADGALASQSELAISLERMTGIESVDIDGGTMTVMAGTVIQSVQDKAAEHDLLFAVDWGARGSAMVGGAIATNAGGNSVLRYGMMREQVLGLEVVLADGTVLSSMNRLLKNNSGYDLKQLFIGSEGTLGIITRAVLRLRTAPKSEQTALIAMQTFDDVIALLGRVNKEMSGALSAFEVMWQEHYEMIVTEGGHQWALPRGYPYYVLLESNGGSQQSDAEHFENVLGSLIEDELILDAVLAASSSQREALWAIREDVDTFLRVLEPPITFDVSVPIGDMEEYVARVRADMKAELPHARGTVFGHLGDNNLHFCWTVGTNDPDERAMVSTVVYRNLQPYGGAVSAEHGIGIAKRKYLSLTRNAAEIEWMHKLKRLFDPNNLLNPGRVIDLE